MATATPPSPTADNRRLLRALQRAFAQIQDHVAALVGISTVSRSRTVVTMLESNARRVPGYWIQLLLSTGIATLGLVLGSTAVVIAAMLVSPLMGPILELGMGFAVGSSLLLLRSMMRVAVSTLWVIAGATLITYLVPFHEVTAEVTARTAPTALDLLVAILCALTAVYTTVRPGSDTTAAAAGTAIGIALVPPLCVVGFGLGTGSGAIASGALLLFVANLAGILVFSVVSFLILGYNRVEAISLEQEYLERPETRFEEVAQRVHRFLAGLLGSRYGLAMRMLVPLGFLAVVYVPLSRALDDVAWHVRVRDEIRRIVASESSRAVQNSLTIDRRNVTLRLWMVGSRNEAEVLERQLETRIAAVAGVQPRVTVSAVPDATTLAAASAARSDRGPEGPVHFDVLRPRLREALTAVWPPDAAGRLVGWQLELDSRGAMVLRVRHVGAALGAAGEALLARHLAVELGAPLQVADDPLPAEPLTAARGAETLWLIDATRIVSAALQADSVVACARGPGATRTDRAVREALHRAAAGDEKRLMVEPARSWSIRVALGSCAGYSGPGGDQAGR